MAFAAAVAPQLPAQFRTEIEYGWQHWDVKPDIDWVCRRGKVPHDREVQPPTLSETDMQAAVNGDILALASRKHFKADEQHEERPAWESRKCMQVFGVDAGIGEVVQRRKNRNPHGDASRMDVLHQAEVNRDLSAMAARRHFEVAPTVWQAEGDVPLGQADVELQLVDIDSQYTKRRLGDCLPERTVDWGAAAEGALPFDSATYDDIKLRRPFWDNKTRADQYAQLLGRLSVPANGRQTLPARHGGQKVVVRRCVRSSDKAFDKSFDKAAADLSGIPLRMRRILFAVLPNGRTKGLMTDQTQKIRQLMLPPAMELLEKDTQNVAGDAVAATPSPEEICLAEPTDGLKLKTEDCPASPTSTMAPSSPCSTLGSPTSTFGSRTFSPAGGMLATRPRLMGGTPTPPASRGTLGKGGVGAKKSPVSTTCSSTSTSCRESPCRSLRSPLPSPRELSPEAESSSGEARATNAPRDDSPRCDGGGGGASGGKASLAGRAKTLFSK